MSRHGIGVPNVSRLPESMDPHPECGIKDYEVLRANLIHYKANWDFAHEDKHDWRVQTRPVIGDMLEQIVFEYAYVLHDKYHASQ